MAFAKTNPVWEFLNAYNVETALCLPTNLMCMICNKILVNARQTPCGCRFCAECVTREFRKGSIICPGRTEDCSEQVLSLNNDITCDNNANREISKLVIKCPNYECRCEYELRKMIDHVSVCEYKEELCHQCHKTVLKKNMEHHSLRECEWRELSCEFCGVLFTYRELQQVHNNVQHELLCDQFRGVCPNLCGARHIIIVKPHLATCSNRPEPCPFATIGCALVNIPRQQMDEHLATESHNHAKSMVNYIDNLNNEIKALKLANVAMHRSIEPLNMVTDILNQNVFEPRHNDFIWNVENFSKILQNAVDGRVPFIVSKPFLSDRYGYKMSLKLFPNGDGDGQGRYLSLFFLLLHGKYDDLLQWPFKGTVTLTLMNCAGRENYVKTGNFNTIAINLTDSHAGAGCVKFFEIAELAQLGFLKNDNLHIKCTIN